MPRAKNKYGKTHIKKNDKLKIENRMVLKMLFNFAENKLKI
mgnify:CR=1 FL=1